MQVYEYVEVRGQPQAIESSMILYFSDSLSLIQLDWLASELWDVPICTFLALGLQAYATTPGCWGLGLLSSITS